MRKRLANLQHLGYLRLSPPGMQLHHKFAIIDDAVVTGSANWTKAAWTKNHEVVAVIRPNARTKDQPSHLQTYLSRHGALWDMAGN